MDQIPPTRGSIEESVTGETANHLFYSTNRPLPILHSHILYQVASCLDDNVKTLRAMCSVSRNWREASRPFTFRLVNIKFLWQLEDFLQFLWSESSIGGWVHTLNVELPGSSYGYSGSQYFELLVTLSKGFPALRTLALNGFDDTDFRSTPADFDFYTSAFPLLETLSLNAEELRFEDLVDFICRVPRIKHLTILGVSGGGTKPQQEPEQLPVTTGLNLPQLETIELLSSLASLKNLLLWLSSSSIIKTVKKLKTAMPFSPIAADLQVFGHFLKSIGPSLEELFLDMTPLPLGEGRVAPYFFLKRSLMLLFRYRRRAQSMVQHGTSRTDILRSDGLFPQHNPSSPNPSPKFTSHPKDKHLRLPRPDLQVPRPPPAHFP